MGFRTGTGAALRGALAAGLCVSLGVSGVVLAGDLNPPPAPIAPTMKTLEEIDPRVVVNNLPGAADAVRVISAPGNYVLTGDLTAGAGLNGILVTASDVTLDLNGFSIRGLPGSLDGIRVDAPTPVIFAARGYIKIGDIKGEITGFSGNGVTVVRAARASFGGMTVTHCGGDGFSVVMENVSLNFEEIKVTYTKCEALSNGGDGFDITLMPGGPSAYTVKLTVTDSNGNAGHGVVVRGSGFPPPPPGTVDITRVIDLLNGAAAFDNGGDGFRFEFDNTIRPSVTMKKARVRHNSGSGVNAVSLTTDTIYDLNVEDVDASFNTVNGLTVSGNLTVNGATLSNNGGNGIDYLAPGEPVKGIGISLEQIVGASNGGNGGAFTWPVGSAPYTLTVRSSSFSSNTLNGLLYLDDDSDDDGLLDFGRVVASNNGGGGFVTRTLDKASPKLYEACAASGNGGSGFDQTGGSASYNGCTASNNTVHGFFYDGGGLVTVLESYAVDYRFSTSTNNGLDGFNLFAHSASVADSTSVGNLRDGMRVTAPDASFQRCASRRNAGNGFFFDGRRAAGALGEYDTDYGRCTASNNGLDGFKLFADNVVVSSSSASSNLGDGFDLAPGEPVQGIGISLEQPHGISNGGNGITVVNGRLTLGGGTISGNGGSGISASNSSLYTFEVTVTDNLTGGVVVADAVRVRLVDSVVDNNTGNGVTSSSAVGLATGPVTLRRCSLTGNTGTGCSIASSVGGQVTECEASNNGLVGIEVLTSGFVLTGNVTAANPAGNMVVLLPGNAVGPPVGAMIISADNNFANTGP